jgi:hypothetical protein
MRGPCPFVPPYSHFASQIPLCATHEQIHTPQSNAHLFVISFSALASQRLTPDSAPCCHEPADPWRRFLSLFGCSSATLITHRITPVCFKATLCFPSSRKSNQTTGCTSRTAMNNPALPLYASQTAGPYAFNNPHPNAAYAIPPGMAIDHAQTHFQPGMMPNHMQKPVSHPHQPHQPIPQHLYQQQPDQVGAGTRPQSRSSYSPQAQG